MSAWHAAVYEVRGRGFLSTSIFIALGLVVIVGWAAYVRSSMFDPVIFSYNGFGRGPKTSDIWFDGDIPKTFLLMTDTAAHQHRVATEHPLISLIMYPPAALLRWAGLAPVTSVRAVFAIVSGLWSALLFALLRSCGMRRLDSLLFAVLGSVSASAMFWMPAPDSFLFGSVTICAALCLTKWPDHGASLARHTVVNALSLSMTITNWMVGLLVSFRKLALRDALLAAMTAWFVVCVLWGVQKMLFPASQFFLGSLRTTQFTYAPTPARLATALQSFVSHTIVMPALQILEKDDFRGLSVQFSLAGSASVIGAIATIAWLCLLALGCWSLRQVPRSSLLFSCTLLALAQLGLHLLHGWETFLYSMHFLPLLILIAAAATLTRYRTTALTLAAIVTLFGGLNNWSQFGKGVEFIAETAARAHALVPK